MFEFTNPIIKSVYIIVLI